MLVHALRSSWRSSVTPDLRDRFVPDGRNERRSSPRAFRRVKAGRHIWGDRLILWPHSTPYWGWTYDAYGRVLRLGWLTYYPKRNA